ncbi:MAG: Tm-1-like ATP-binding domain-containing protein [Acidobacteria bacterium]|nr:Tm-1-like ATP-binding domain-containing protein [Acidobacteriota bacterium]
MASKTILVLATLDTKGREAEFPARQIEECGHSPLLVDSEVVAALAVYGGISREQVALAG